MKTEQEKMTDREKILLALEKARTYQDESYDIWYNADDVEEAMEEYANESIKFYYEGLMSDFNLLLKDFYLWIDRNYALGMLTDKSDDVINEYLNQNKK